MKKRIVSLLLVFCMVITLVPANVLADEVKGLAETTAGQTQTAGTTAAKPENPFADVKSGSWYEAAVLYARANGFFDGTSATTFEPDGPMTDTNSPFSRWKDRPSMMLKSSLSY